MDESGAKSATGALRSGLGTIRGAALTPAEQEFLRLRAQGLTSGEIGARVHRSEQTVKNHVQRAYDKLGVRNIVEAMHAMGWVDVP